jgi:glycosyltransferase
MKISIITVCYNSAGHLADALRSVDSQRWSDLEHVIVDGASTDATPEVLRAHADPRRSVVSEKDKGIYDAMNKGLRRAQGEVVGFLNADDFLAGDDVIEAIARAFEQDPSLDALYGDLEYVRDDAQMRTIRRWRSGPFLPGHLRHGWMPPHPTFYVRRSLLERVGGFDTRYRIAADYDFMMRCLTLPDIRVHYLPRLLVRMRLGGASNASVRAMLRKSREDLRIMRAHRIGGLWSLVAKNVRKVPQFVRRSRTTG